MVILEIRDYGTIRIELDASAAPRTVRNFEKLVSSGFYDGLTFHRVIPDFMIQGGDPLGNGTGSSDANIPGEFRANGYDNPLRHKRGTISMARAQDPDSASCQFFICQTDCPYLDGQYAAFGQVVDGMDVVDSVAAVRTDMRDRPVRDVVIERMFIEPELDGGCLFCRIIRGEIPSSKVYEDSRMLAFRDISPQAPVHVLVIPKKHIESVDRIDRSNSWAISAIFEKLPAIAKEAGLTGGYRVVSNCGADACQSVKHLHFHILGGRQLSDTMA